MHTLLAHAYLYDILALWRSGLSVRVSGCQKLQTMAYSILCKTGLSNSGRQRVNSTCDINVLNTWQNFCHTILHGLHVTAAGGSRPTRPGYTSAGLWLGLVAAAVTDCTTVDDLIDITSKHNTHTPGAPWRIDSTWSHRQTQWRT